MKISDVITHKIQTALSPSYLEVIDDSHKHAGHVGARPEGETHFTVIIQAKTLESMSRIDRHRTITNILKEEMDNPIHALSIKIKP